MIGVCVTGTDTGVGKTIVGCALSAALAERGARVGVMKPVETGVTDDATDSDAQQLARASGSLDELLLVRPYAFSDPVAPLVAARRADTSVDLTRLDRAFRTISTARDIVLVEGSGGLLVPITPTETFETLAARWHLGLIIVAANRLGVINHALLTLRAASSAGLHVIAVVLTETSPRPADESAHSNADVLSELAAPIRVLRFPWLHQVGDHPAAARAAEACGLVDAVAPLIGLSHAHS